MLNASRANPHLVAQIVPSPMSFRVDNLLQKLVGEGYLGDLLAVEMQILGPDFVDTSGPLHWRHDRDLSGYNILNMGIWYEAMIRWVGRATKVMAMTTVNVSNRQDEDGNGVGITIPDHVDILCQLANGAQAHMRFSSVTGLSRGNEIWLYGSEGTLHLDQRLNVSGGKRGDPQLSDIANPPEMSVRLAGGRGVHQRHPGPGASHPHSIPGGGALHGMDRGRDPQRPDRAKRFPCRFNFWLAALAPGQTHQKSLSPRSGGRVLRARRKL